MFGLGRSRPSQLHEGGHDAVDAYFFNPFNLHRMNSNLWEWRADAWNEETNHSLCPSSPRSGGIHHEVRPRSRYEAYEASDYGRGSQV